MAVDHDPAPTVTQSMAENRNLHYDRAVHFGDLSPNRPHDVGVSDCLQSLQLIRVVEHDCCQGRSVDLPVTDYMRPLLGDLAEGWATCGENGMTDAVGVHRGDTGAGQHFADLALAGGQAATQYPPVLLSSHGPRR